MTDTPDPQMDTQTVVQMLLEVLTNTRTEGHETPETARANTYLFERLMNYKVMMRQRTLDSNYEFLITPDGKYGWYYKPSNSSAFNWIGPFASRKAAVAAKLNRPGVAKKPLDIIEREIFGAEA